MQPSSEQHIAQTITTTTTSTTTQHSNNLQQVVAELQTSCSQSSRYELWLRRRLARQVQRTGHLEQQLRAERERNRKLRQALQIASSEAARDGGDASAKRRRGVAAVVERSDACTASSSMARMPNGTSVASLTTSCSSSSTTTTTLTTVSPLLAQYQYDELNAAYQRCVRRLQRSRQRAQHAETERSLVSDQFDELLDKYRVVHERLELVCSKYLELYGRKVERVAIALQQQQQQQLVVSSTPLSTTLKLT